MNTHKKYLGTFLKKYFTKKDKKLGKISGGMGIAVYREKPFQNKQVATKIYTLKQRFAREYIFF